MSISEENKRGLAEIRNEGALASIPQKQKTSKAERRAIQEAQRAAKVAAKDAGNYHGIDFSLVSLPKLLGFFDRSFFVCFPRVCQ